MKAMCSSMTVAEGEFALKRIRRAQEKVKGGWTKSYDIRVEEDGRMCFCTRGSLLDYKDVELSRGKDYVAEAGGCWLGDLFRTGKYRYIREIVTSCLPTPGSCSSIIYFNDRSTTTLDDVLAVLKKAETIAAKELKRARDRERQARLRGARVAQA